MYKLEKYLGFILRTKILSENIFEKGLCKGFNFTGQMPTNETYLTCGKNYGITDLSLL